MSLDLGYLSDRQVISCVCGKAPSVVFHRRDRYGLPFSYVLCLRCGHVRTKNPLSDLAAERFYGSSDYRKLYNPNQSPIDILHRQSPKANTQSRLLTHAQVIGLRTGTVIEYGCGGGWNLVPFRDAGWKTIGYDPDAVFVELGRVTHSLDLRVVAMGGAPVTPPEVPDLVILFHVLEHFLDPVTVLRQIRSWCTPDTRVIVGVPLLEKIRSWRFNSFFHVAHIHYFSRRSLEWCANEAGFELVQEHSTNMFVLRTAPQQNYVTPRRIGVLVSAWNLMIGFLHPSFRLRQAMRRLIVLMGLLSTARKVKGFLKIQ